MKFYSPLTADFCMDEFAWEDEPVMLAGEDLLEYEESISDALQNENAAMADGDLMPYYHATDGVSEKVVRAVVSVEAHKGKLCGCATVQLREPLTETETLALKEYLCGQYSDGFGEGFEQREIRVDGGALFVHLWQPDGFSFEQEYIPQHKEKPQKKPDPMNHPMKKYEITDMAHPRDPALHRIRAIRSVGENVKAGDLGGYVQSEENLSQEMDAAWIFDDAVCCEEALVTGSASLLDQATACGYALVSGTAEVGEYARVEDHGMVLAGTVQGQARVCGNGVVRINESSGLAPVVDGNATVMGTVSGAVYLSGQAFILPGATVDHPLENVLGLDSKRAILYDKSLRLLKPPKTPER